MYCVHYCNKSGLVRTFLTNIYDIAQLTANDKISSSDRSRDLKINTCTHMQTWASGGVTTPSRKHLTYLFVFSVQKLLVRVSIWRNCKFSLFPPITVYLYELYCLFLLSSVWSRCSTLNSGFGSLLSLKTNPHHFRLMIDWNPHWLSVSNSALKHLLLS